MTPEEGPLPWCIPDASWCDGHQRNLRVCRAEATEVRAALLAELEEDIYRSLGHDIRELAEGAEEALHCAWPTMMLRVLDLIRKAGGT